MHVDGAYADYIVIEKEHLHAIPDDVPREHAAIAEPTSIATRAVFTQSWVTPGDDVLVSGLDRDKIVRFPLLEDADIEMVNVQSGDLTARRETFMDGIDFGVVFDTTGHESGVEMAVDNIRKGGQIVVVGLSGETSELFMTPVSAGRSNSTPSTGPTVGTSSRRCGLSRTARSSPRY